MNDETIITKKSSRYLLGLGASLTIGVVGIFVYSHRYGEVCSFWGECISKWEYLKAATPNEIGDTLAGYAGTLAFVWLVVTVCLQAVELREQRLEFVKMADAQEDQVRLLVQQGEIFSDEQRQRDEVRAKAQLNELLIILHSSITTIRRVEWHLSVNKTMDVEGLVRRGPSQTKSIFGSKLWSENLVEKAIRPYISSQQSTDEYIMYTAKGLRGFNSFMMQCPRDQILNKPLRTQFSQLCAILKRILDLRSRLAEDQITRLEYLEVPSLALEVANSLELEIWETANT